MPENTKTTRAQDRVARGETSAFPIPEGGLRGLSRREYFAAAALQGLVAGGSTFGPGTLARMALHLADALIEELELPQ